MDAAAAAGGDGWLSSGDARDLLATYGVPVVRTKLVRSPGEAADAQRDLGDAVAVKVAAPIHKTDVGGVRLGVATPQDAADAVRVMRADLQARGLGRVADAFLVQEQIASGREMIVGVNHDPLFGPLVMVGLGGELVEVLGDVAVRITPLTDADIDDMLRSLKSYPLLTGYRGQSPLDVQALRDILHRISALVEDLPEVAEIDLNPVFVREHGALVADVRIRIATSPP